MDSFNLLENLVGQAPSTLIMATVMYYMYRLYIKEKSARIKVQEDFNAYLISQVDQRDEVIKGNTKVLSEIYKRQTTSGRQQS